MKSYIIRSLKYLLQLVVLFFILFGIMELTGTSSMNNLGEVFLSPRGVMLLIFIVILAIFYPMFGFTKREVKANIEADQDKIAKAFEMGGYTLESSSGDTLVFRARGIAKRILLMWEDEITVTRDDNYVLIVGVRKEVVKAEYRLKSML